MAQAFYRTKNGLNRGVLPLDIALTLFVEHIVPFDQFRPAELLPQRPTFRWTDQATPCALVAEGRNLLLRKRLES